MPTESEIIKVRSAMVAIFEEKQVRSMTLFELQTAFAGLGGFFSRPEILGILPEQADIGEFDLESDSNGDFWVIYDPAQPESRTNLEEAVFNAIKAYIASGEGDIDQIIRDIEGENEGDDET